MAIRRPFCPSSTVPRWHHALRLGSSPIRIQPNVVLVVLRFTHTMRLPEAHGSFLPTSGIDASEAGRSLMHKNNLIHESTRLRSSNPRRMR